ncbi:MAG TPA: energy transducer TonB [Polyangia bacterium]|nr:energy transducer TonB [Polyangia bacterium]
MRRGRFKAERFLAVLLLSAAFHAFVQVPLLVRLLKEPMAPQAPENTEIALLEEPGEANFPPPELPPVPPTPESTRTPRPTPDREKPEPARPEPKPPEQPPPEVAKVEPPKPEPKPDPKPEPPKEQVPPPPIVELPKQRFKMVDQDLGDEEPDNQDARYLAQKNHRAAEDTSALDTNLVKDLRPKTQERLSTPSENQLPEAGDKDRKVAELEDRKGRPDLLPRGAPKQPGESGEAQRKSGPGKLSMRDLTPRAIEQKALGKPREGVELSEQGEGPLPLARVGDGGERARAAAKGGKKGYNFLLDPTAYDRIVGFDTAEKERQVAARGERSHVPGHWDRMQQKLALMRSSLENFTPEVRPGNQAELGTRAHPFAAYIAEMHRQIHKLWAFGFLAEQDGRGSRGAYDDPSLWTQLEIVLRGDGSLEKVTIVRTSGNTGFDVAAIDAVSSSAPFPKPPAAIKSANGKVYLDWRFHRDDRQCGTYGVDPHILTTVGENQDHDTSEVEPGVAPRVAPPRVLRRGTEEALPSLGRGSAEPAPARPREEPAEPSEPATPTAIPEAVREAAQGWFAAYGRGDVGWLAGWSAVPFVAGGHVAAQDAPAIKKVYAELVREADGDRRAQNIEVYTAAGIRGRLGALPPGGEAEGMYFAIGRVGREDWVLLLKKSAQGWRVAGLAR